MKKKTPYNILTVYKLRKLNKVVKELNRLKTDYSVSYHTAAMVDVCTESWIIEIYDILSYSVLANL